MKKKVICLLLCFIWLFGCNKDQPEQKASNKSSAQQSKQSVLNEDKDTPVITAPKSSTEQNPLPSPNQESVYEPIRIVSIGDSQTQGIGDSSDNGGYLPYLEKNLEQEPTIQSVEIVNYGVSGNRSDQLLKRLDKKEIRHHVEQANSIVVTIGGNDIMKVVKKNFSDLKIEQFKSAQEDYLVTLSQILDKIRSYNETADIYLVGIYNPLSSMLTDFYEFELVIDEWNKSEKELVAQYDSVYFIAIDDIFQNTNENLLYTKDNFHPNDRGYELIATRIYNNMDLSAFVPGRMAASAKGDEQQE